MVESVTRTAVVFPGQGSQVPGMRDVVADHCPDLLAACIADVGEDPFPDAPASGCLCGHEIAFLVLSGLRDAWRAQDDPARARRASGLRVLLPLEPDVRAQVLEESLRI